MTRFRETGNIWEAKSQIRLQGEKRRAQVTVGLLEPHRDDRILDVGCAEGYQISYVVKQSERIVGLDISTGRLRKAKRRMRDVCFVRASSERLPFRPQVFNKVLCLELLEHLKEPHKTILEIEFALRIGGTIIVSVPYKERIVATQCVHCGKLTPLWGHIQSFDAQKLIRLLPNNLKVTKHFTTGTIVGAYPLFSSLPTSLWKLLDDCSKVLPGVKPSWILLKARKSETANRKD